jgi:enterochelin esterase family protein
VPLDPLPPTAVEGDELVFRRADPEHELDGVSVWCDVDLGGDLTLEQVTGGWELRLPLPDLDCVEYLLEPAGGSPEIDAANPLRVDGAFGEHSWLPLPGYAAPAWLDETGVDGTLTPIEVEDTAVGRVDAAVWEPAGAAGPLPLLLAHDGPEMDRFAGLTRFVAAGIAAGRLPAMRVALLSPGARNERYAANPAYAAALVDDVLPALLDRWPSDDRPVLSGQSLGGLAALHAAWTSADTFAGLFLQAGSFFTAELDPQESGFEFWAEVTGFVASLLDASTAAPGAPRTTLTCGTAEENLANNRLLADHLRATGVDVAWGEARQGHTWTCWRDLLDPHLTDLLRTVWA